MLEKSRGFPDNNEHLTSKSDATATWAGDSARIRHYTDNPVFQKVTFSRP